MAGRSLRVCLALVLAPACSGRNDGARADAALVLDAAADAPLAPDAAPVDAPFVPDAALEPDASPDAGVLTDTVILEVRAVSGIRTQDGAVTVSFAGMETGLRVLNVVADLDGNGTIAAYDVAAGTQEEWLVRDEPLLLHPGGEATYPFALVDPAAGANAPIHLRVVVSAAELGAPPALAGNGQSDVTLVVVDGPELVNPGADAFGAGAAPDAGPLIKGLDQPLGDIDIVGGFYRPGLPHLRQGPNSCVLHTLASQLSWLARTYGFADCMKGMPAGDDPFDATTAEGLNVLPYAIDTAGAFGYSPATGVPTANIQLGKDQLAIAWGLPIDTQILAAADGTDLLTEAKVRMRQGCAIEVGVRASNNQKHFVGLAGFIENLDTGATRFIIRDPDTSSFDNVYRAGHTPDGKPTLDNFRLLGKVRPVYIDLLVVECVSKVRTLTLDYEHGPLPAGTLVRLACVAGGHEAEPDLCLCQHYHGDGVTIEGGPAVDDQFPFVCGHGCVDLHDFKDLDVTCCGPR